MVVAAGHFFPLKSFTKLNIAIEKGVALDFIFQLLTQSVFSCKLN